MFHQMEGLVVDKGITLCDLQGMLDKFVQALFGAEVKTRLRPSYFPFTEPSVRGRCFLLRVRWQGCLLCKHTGWIEALAPVLCITACWKTAASTPMSIRLCLRHRYRAYRYAEIRHQQHRSDV